MRAGARFYVESEGWIYSRPLSREHPQGCYRRSIALGIVFGERITDMNKQLKNLVPILIILLLSACGPGGNASTSLPVATDSPGIAPATGLASEKFRHYVGLNYPPLPGGLTEGFSMLIQGAEDHSLFLLSEGETKMLWLSELTHQDSTGNAYWEVEDVLDLSGLESGLSLLPDGCLLNGVPDNEIIVVAEDGVIVSAWRANTTTHVFEVIHTSGIECHSDKGIILE